MSSEKPLLAGVMGWPIHHSRSPRLHNYWLRQHRIAGQYMPLPIMPEQLALALRALPVLGYAGCNLTLPHKTAAMALMESPAIIMAVIFANMLRRERAAAEPSSAENTTPLGKILHESFTDGAQLLLLGAMLVGIITGEAGKAVMAPFSVDLFKGMLSFFLLDMGLMAARNMHELRGKSPWIVAYGLLGPVTHASLALGLCLLFGIGPGDGALLMVLAASASYIAVPAVLRFAIPEANPSLYFGLSLGLTFPINILFGIPVYVAVAQAVLA
ncbi:MAG: hypothetical protein EB121_00770 [Alphaproteobacteria bacterium]|nr:hypothetical protein [Alphaproteobacteria bacterium]